MTKGGCYDDGGHVVRLTNAPVLVVTEAKWWQKRTSDHEAMMMLTAVA